ncbi:MAG: DUF302 domain-containing protein [Burkholderiaceae bacterium]|nr:DUF302 domain-containing protein [Burkholderiaceae bacterium]
MNRRFVPLAVACAVLAGAAAAQTPSANFIVKATAKTPEAVVSDLKSRVLQNNWLYLAEFKVKNNEVTVVKMCVPAAGKDIWSAGLHVSALLPCGHFGVYREDGTTKVSLLDPRFMNLLNPHPGLKKAGEDLHPLLTKLLDEVTN